MIWPVARLRGTRRTPGSGKAGLLRRLRPTLEVRRQGGEPGRTRPRSTARPSIATAGASRSSAGLQSAPSNPVARFLVGRAFPRAAANHAGRFLEAVEADRPFPAVDPGRRRLGVHGPIRTALRRTRTAPARPAARAPPVERPRRTLQRHTAPGVPGPSRRRTRRRHAGRAPALAQPGRTPCHPCRSRHALARRAPCPARIHAVERLRTSA